MLSTFLKLPFVIKICVCLFLSGRFTQVLLYSVKQPLKFCLFLSGHFTHFTVWNRDIPGLKIKSAL